jgi:alcohol dehydrogenase class IV
MRTAWNFHSAGQLVFGRGACAQLGSLLARRKWMRVFVVTDKPSGRIEGTVRRTEDVVSG